MDCSFGCGNKAIFKLKNGKEICNLDYRKCPSFRKKLSESIKNKWKNNDKRKLIASINAKKQWVETNTLSSEEVIKKRNKSLKEVWKDEGRRERNRQSNKLFWNKSDIVEERRKKSKELFKDDNYLKKLIFGINRHPNKPEKYLLTLLEKILPEEYIFTGDFSFWVNGKNPDFICKNKMKIIEFFGEFWHKNENQNERIDHFRKVGYDTLILWENEFKNLEQVQNKILSFHER